MNRNVRRRFISTIEDSGDVVESAVDTVARTLTAAAQDAILVGRAGSCAIDRLTSSAIRGAERTAALAGISAVNAADRVARTAGAAMRDALTDTLVGVRAALEQPVRSR